jgi:hypothetical protein
MKINDIINESNEPPEGSLAAQMMATARGLGMNPRIPGTPEQERARTAEIMRKREAERREKARMSPEELEQIESELEEIVKQYKELGGNNWQYADREQNLTHAERHARSLEPKISALHRRIRAAKEANGDVNEELTMKHQRDHDTQRRPDTSNSLADRDFQMSEVPNVSKSFDGHPTVKWRHHGHAGHSRVEPTITPTTVKRKDSDRPIPTFLKMDEDTPVPQSDYGMPGFGDHEQQVQETIVKKGGEYEVQSKAGKNLGHAKTKKGAIKRLGQVEYFKHHPGK